MISRRAMMTGLAAVAVPPLAGCAGQQPRSFRDEAEPVPASPGNGLNTVIDINHANVVSDFATVRAGGMHAVLHKATEGGDWRDPLYSRRRAEAQAAGLLWGAYHFGTRRYSGAQQAAIFLAATEGDPATLLALDLEPNELNPGNSMTIDQAEEFVQAVQLKTGRLPLLYTHPAWANGSGYRRTGLTLGRPIGPRSILSRCDLWLANYTTQPSVPSAWSDRGWRFWQYAGDSGGAGPYGPLSRTVAGVERCDRDLFSGTATQLRAYWGGTAGPLA